MKKILAIFCIILALTTGCDKDKDKGEHEDCSCPLAGEMMDAGSSEDQGVEDMMPEAGEMMPDMDMPVDGGEMAPDAGDMAGEVVDCDACPDAEECDC